MEPTNAIPARMNIMNPGVGGFDVLRRLFYQNRVFHNILSFQLIYGRKLCPVCGRIPDGTRKYPRAKVTLASAPCVDLHTDRDVPVSNGTTCRNRSTPQSGKQNRCRKWCVFFSASQKRSAKGKISARSEFPGLFQRACQ